jgi:hypothetical protein
MDQRLIDRGRLVTNCPSRARCPGILSGRVTNDPAHGSPARGLFLQPGDASLDDVTLVVLGLNPAPADEQERKSLRDAAEVHPGALFEWIHRLTLQEMHRWRYWQRIRDLTDRLPRQPDRPVLLAVERAFCECAPGVRHPGAATLRHCSEIHLERIARLVRPGVPWLCVGADARNWFQRSGLGERHPWAWVEHVTGVWGAFSRMFTGAELCAEVSRAWSTALDRHGAGACLSRAIDPGGGRAADEPMFWVEVEELFLPPVTTNGPRATKHRTYRQGNFAPHVTLAAVADTEGRMGVELLSTHKGTQTILQHIVAEIAGGVLAPPPGPGTLRLHAGPSNPEYLYLDFEWRRADTYLPELDAVRAYVDWLVDLRGQYF